MWRSKTSTGGRPQRDAPKVEFFTGYEAYSERDPNVGPEFNHGYVVGLNASWAIFDGFATRGRMQATRARRDGAILALKAVRLGIESEVRSAFLDLQQAESVLKRKRKTCRRRMKRSQFARATSPPASARNSIFCGLPPISPAPGRRV